MERRWTNCFLHEYDIIRLLTHSPTPHLLHPSVQRVLGNESDAFWCFSQYVRRIGSDFTAEGMKEKLETLRRLLTALDVALIQHLQARQADDLLACHRWLHLGFKREFPLEQSIKIL